MGLEEPNDPCNRIGGHRVGIREVEAVLSTGIDDLLRFGSNRSRQVYEFLALHQWNSTIGIAVQFDKGRQMFDLGDHRIGHATVQDDYRRYALIMSRCVSGDVAA